MTQKDERYTDQLQLNIKVVGSDRVTPVEEFFAAINVGRTIDRALVRDLLVETLNAPNYLLTEQHNVTHWGAAGASFGLIMTVAEGAAGNLLAIYIQRLIDRLDIGQPPRPLSEEEAESQARARLCRRYEVDFKELTLASVDTNLLDNRATVEMLGPDGTEYRVEMERTKTNVVITRVTRKRPQ